MTHTVAQPSVKTPDSDTPSVLARIIALNPGDEGLAALAAGFAGVSPEGLPVLAAMAAALDATWEASQ